MNRTREPQRGIEIESPAVLCKTIGDRAQALLSQDIVVFGKTGQLRGEAAPTGSSVSTMSPRSN